MKHIEYWESNDGNKFASKTACMEYEIQLLKKNNGILYYDCQGKETDNFDYAWTVILSKELSDEDYKKFQELYSWTVPNAVGRYTWNNEIEDWE